MSLTPSSWRARLARATSWRVLAGFVLTLGAVSALWTAIEGLAQRRVMHQQIHSVAVLPFQWAGTSRQQFLSEGLGRALADKLGIFASLRTTPWLTSQRYRSDTATPADLGRQLGVEFLATGTIRAGPDSLEVGVVLVDAASGTPVWQCWRGARNALDLQNALIEAVASRVRGTLTASQRRMLRVNCHDARSYESYLEGLSNLQQGNPGANSAAELHFARAIERDSTFAPAHAGLGAVQLERFIMHWDAGDVTLGAAQRSFERALQLDPHLLEAQQGLIQVAWLTGRPRDALARGRALATERLPLPGVLLVRAEAYLYGGLPSKALPLLEQVIALDPNNAAAHWARVAAAARCGRPRDALRFGDEYLRLFREDAEVRFWMAAAAQQLGDLGGARGHLEAAAMFDPSGRRKSFLASVLRQMKFPALAESVERDALLALQRESGSGRGLDSDRIDVQAQIMVALSRLGRTQEFQAIAAKIEPSAAQNERVARALIVAYDEAGDAKSAARVIRAKIAAGLLTEDDTVFVGSPFGLGRFASAPEYAAERREYRQALDGCRRSY